MDKLANSKEPGGRARRFDLSLDVRIYQPGEKGKRIRRTLFWPGVILLIGALTFLVIKVGPRWFGYERHLTNQAAMVRVYDAPDTRAQIIAGKGDKKVVGDLPDLIVRHPDGSADIPLDKVVDKRGAKIFANHRVLVQNAQIVRVLGEDVIGIGDATNKELLVHIPADVRPANNSQLDAKARVNIAGVLKPMPPIDRAKELLRLKNLSVESHPLPAVYLEAEHIRLVESKPMYGDAD